MPSEAVNAMTREEWRELGFFYDRDDTKKCWRLVGSKEGLARFSDLLRAYAANPRHDAKSEHDHFGPYMYLKVMTWPEAGIDANAIRGTLGDLLRLATLVDEWLATASPGDTENLAPRYAATCAYALEVIVKADGFDPVSEDPCLT
ncbi:MAG: hypothetical protein WCH77_06425 [Planctomycetota bacterium]